MRRSLLSVSAATALLLGACGIETSTDADPAPDDDQGASPTDEAPVETDQDVTEPGAVVTNEDAADTDVDVTEVEGEDEAEDWSDRPEAYSSLYTDGVEPNLETTDGEVSIAAMAAPPYGTTIPMIVHNGTSELVSRVEVTGALVDADGSTVTSGGSQGFEPNAIPSGEYAIGYFFGGSGEVPADASLDQISIDYELGLHSFEIKVAVDITELDANTERATGTVANPHDVDVGGPIFVDFACLDDAGSLVGLWSSHSDRSGRIEAGGTSTFTIEFYNRGLDCAGVIAAAWGRK